MALVLALALAIQLATVVSLWFFGFYDLPASEMVFISLLDTALSVLVVGWVYRLREKRVKRALYGVRVALKNAGYFPLIIVLLLVGLALFEGFKSLSLIARGVTRQGLQFEYGVVGLQLFVLSSFFKIAFSTVFVVDERRWLMALLAAGLAGTMLISASRSELAHIGYIIIFIAAAIGLRRQALRITLFGCSALFLAALMTTLQGRPIEDGVKGALNIFEKHVLYRAYSIHLSEIAVEYRSGIASWFYAFFGYFSDRILIAIFGIGDAVDTAFVSRYHFIGYDKEGGHEYFANVLYPWWSWFVAAFGGVGVVVKAIYAFLILWFTASKGFVLTFCYVGSFLLFLGPYMTPLITVGGVMAVVIALVLDVFIKRKDVARRAVDR